MFSQFKMDIGITKVLHKNKLTSSYVGNKNFDSFVKNLNNSIEYEIVKIPAGYGNRPDLISEVFYDTPGYWWLILLVNGIVDPFEGLNVGDKIVLPKNV